MGVAFTGVANAGAGSIVVDNRRYGDREECRESLDKTGIKFDESKGVKSSGGNNPGLTLVVRLLVGATSSSVLDCRLTRVDFGAIVGITIDFACCCWCCCWCCCCGAVDMVE